MANPFSLDLASAQYSAAAAAFVADWDNLVGGPLTFAGTKTGVVMDGDFSAARTHDRHVIELPFANEGDSSTIILRQRYWQLAVDFRAQALGTPAPGRSDLLLIDEENFRHEGGGVISWDRVFASQPQARDVFEDYAYGAQYMYAENGSNRLAEQTFAVPSRVRCDYFHIKDLGNWDVKLALRIVQLTSTVFSKRGQGNLTLLGNIFVSSDAQIVAEDSKLKIWHYPFMERRTRYVAGPTVEFWGSSISL